MGAVAGGALFAADLTQGSAGGHDPSEALVEMRRVARDAPADALALGTSVLAENAALEPALEAAIRCSQGTALFHLQDLEASRREAQVGIRIARGLTDSPAVLVRCLGTLGNAEQTLGSHSAALAAYTEGREVAQSAGDSELYPALSNNMGFLLQKMGELEAAADAYVDALVDSETIEPLRLARRLSNIGTLYNDLGHHRTALDYLERSMLAFERSGGGPRRYKILVNESIAWRGLGEPNRALELLQEALPLQEAVGDTRGTGVALTLLGGVLGDLGRLSEAAYSLDQALEVQRALGLEGDVAATLGDKARVLALSGDYEQAAVVGRESLDSARALEMPLVAKAAMEVLVDAYEALDRPTEALAALRQVNGIDDRLETETLAERLASLERAGGAVPLGVEIGRWWIVALGVLLIVILLSVAQIRRAGLRFAGAEGLVELDVEGEGEIWALCSYCKNVRDEAGRWVRVEERFNQRHGIQTSHGICPTCLSRHAPELDDGAGLEGE